MIVKKQLIIDVIGDIVSKFLYYDRKDDENLPIDSIQDAIEAREISIEEIVDEFNMQLRKSLGENT